MDTTGPSSGTETAKLPHPQPQFDATSIIDAWDRRAFALVVRVASATASTIARSRVLGTRSGSAGFITLRSLQAIRGMHR